MQGVIMVPAPAGRVNQRVGGGVDGFRGGGVAMGGVSGSLEECVSGGVLPGGVGE
jgi:hypothetical protein